ncbi:uncharacterized protein LOC112905610 [Agrilus planipennis]|nr:uncharacterized protein LOC112905610 [Agrilus planipennis]
MHYIEKGKDNHRGHINGTHYLYKHSDLKENNKTCGYGNGKHNHSHKESNEFNRILRYKRALEDTNMIKGPYNANKQSRYVELLLVIDNREYKELGENTKRIDLHCKDIVNIINSLYAPLNIFVALVGVEIWSEYDQIDLVLNGDTTLTNFLHYRKEKLIKQHPNDNAQLLTKFNFDNGVVGKALKGPICTIEYSGGVNTDHSPVVGLVATTVAHEMGHNFGMEHDTNVCSCPDDRCIMAPSSSSVPPTHWSSCSLEYLALAFEHGMDYCLRNKPVALFDSPVCGNGFVEPGEQCDCGLPEHCDNTCCNASSCMLYSNATCATGECCDLKTCRPKAAGTLCRSADYECDLPEYCTGQSEYCPKDIYKIDTEPCDNGKAYCYQGFCRTRSDQCKLLWGDTGKSSDDQCYKMNTKGSRNGNCGYYKLNQSYFKCRDEDVLCGMLHCRHLNERLEFGMESVAIISHTFINLKGSIIPCRTALVDLGINQVDPGLAPDGAKCGDGKMCVNQRCLSVESLRKASPSCPNDCNGNGYCNSLGHCHCKDGFAPPFCDYPGPGGSEDSGPASDPNAQRVFVTVMFIIFLGIIPALAIIGFLSYYTRHNLKLLWKKSAAMKKPPPKPRGMSPFQAPEATKQTEDNHSLLQNESSQSFQSEFFGHFKGFSIAPAKKEEPEVIRPAPPVPPAIPVTPKVASIQKPPPAVPIAPTVTIVKSPNLGRSKTTAGTKISNTLNKPIVRAQSNAKANNIATTISTIHNTSAAPALPPLNPGAHPRPIISSPILENSTCTAKELVSPLKNAATKVPLRPAPTSPASNSRPLSSPDAMPLVIEEEKKTANKDSALNRIASFLKSGDKSILHSTGTLPRKQAVEMKQKKTLDKNVLRTIEISHPIPLSDIPLAKTALPVEGDEKERKVVVMRAQSMRGDAVTKRPNIPNFGSMRQAHGAKRPVSIPSGVRPKSPPPPRPNPHQNQSEKEKTCGSNKKLVTSNKNASQNQYDDCLNQITTSRSEDSVGNDNIYAVIDESPPKPIVPHENNKSSSASSESVGLLGEIVSEIQNRNLDSIYSTSTLARKKKEKEEQERNALEGQDQVVDPLETYVNTASLYKVPDSSYSNMNKSSASSTSSGYINPSSVNPPIKGTDDVKDPSKTITNNVKDELKSSPKKPPVISVKPNSVSDSKNTVGANAKQTGTSSSSSNSNNSDSSEQKSYKPFSTILQRSQGPIAAFYKSNPSPSSPKKLNFDKSESANDKKSATTKPPGRQTTPPNLRTRISSPTRTAPATPKNNTKTLNNNSPDLVTSCSTSSRTPSGGISKSPDVLNGGNSTARKPNIPNPPKVATKINKSLTVSAKLPTDKKPKISENKPSVATKVVKHNSDAGIGNKSISVGAKTVAKQNSTVASLQQKFENKPVTIAKVAAAKSK